MGKDTEGRLHVQLVITSWVLWRAVERLAEDAADELESLMFERAAWAREKYGEDDDPSVSALADETERIALLLRNRDRTGGGPLGIQDLRGRDFAVRCMKCDTFIGNTLHDPGPMRDQCPVCKTGKWLTVERIQPLGCAGYSGGQWYGMWDLHT